MRINKIELKNFRNHRESSYEFEKGINLILGENGSGKTSILDAIGFALFNMKLRSDANETLSMNESSGYVKVFFTGNDDGLYIVTRKFPGSTVTLSEEGSKKNITGVNEVYHAVNTLIGNTMENPALFENVIVASQNRFTSIFDAKPAEREAVFNPVFGTEIYRQMYKGILKESCDVYERQLTFAGGELESKLSQIKDSAELEKARLIAEKEYLTSQKICAESAKKIEDSEKALREYESLKNRKEKLLITIKGVVSQIDDKNKLIESVSFDLKNATAAALEETRLKPEHEEYEKMKTDQEIITGDILVLEKIEKEYLANKEEIAKLEKNKIEAEGDVKRLNQQLESDTVSADGLHAEIEKISGSIDALVKEMIKYEEELTSLTKLKTVFDDLYKKYKESFEQASVKCVLAAKAEESSFNEESLNAELAKYESELSVLELLKTKRENVRSELTRHTTLLSEVEMAERELSKQSCPYLKEKCKNIESAGSISGYFDPRKNEIAQKISELKIETAAYSDLDDRFKKCSNSKSMKTEQLAVLRKSVLDALKYRKDESDYKRKGAEHALAIAKLFTGISGKETAVMPEDDYEKVATEMQRADSGLRTKLEFAATALKEKQVDFNKKNNDLTETLKRIEAAQKKKTEIEITITGYTDEKNRLIESDRVLEQKIISLSDLKKQAVQISGVLKKLEPVDQQYRRFMQTAARKDELQKRFNDETMNIEILTKRNASSISEHDEIVYNTADHEKLILLSGELKTELKDMNTRMMNFKSQFDMSVQIQDNNNRLIRELEDKKKWNDALKRKKDIVDTFRENIKLLGPYISERRTRMIAAAATINYQRMTGRAERILWENNVEQYLVSIVSKAGKRRYNMLSGGEQVAVALSIRSALASEMTDCRFAIFDEPTINLDAEKREALSVSLYDMLKNLEQAIVVTHDTTFREMATKVIELVRVE